MKKIWGSFLVLLFVVFIGNARAENKVTHYLDAACWTWKNDQVEWMPLGYHFTLKEFKKVNILGAGAGWGFKKQGTYRNNLLFVVPIISIRGDIQKNQKGGTTVFFGTLFTFNVRDHSKSIMVGFSVGND